MTKITDIDKNLRNESDSDGLVYFDCMHEPFIITGLNWMSENNNYHRMKDSVLREFSNGIKELSANTSGVQISFITDSKKIGVRAGNEYNNRMPHMAVNGSSGIDVYTGSGTNKSFVKTIFAEMEKDDFSGTFELDGKMNQITLDLPLYSGVRYVEVGVAENAKLGRPVPHSYEKPVVFYGTSITQGA